MKSRLFLLMLLTLFTMSSCTGELDWTGVRYPCDPARPCAENFTCMGGYCTQMLGPGTNPPPNMENRPPLDTPKIAFINQGPTEQNQANEEGRLQLEQAGYQTTSASIMNPNDLASQVSAFVEEGYNVVIGTHPDFLVTMLAQSSKHPNANFLSYAGTETGQNLGSYSGRFYQVEWLAGMAAGKVTKTNRIGIIATTSTAQTIRQINAFTNGVRFANPDAVVMVKWTADPPTPQQDETAAKELMQNNVDVIHPHTSQQQVIALIENQQSIPLKTLDGHDTYTIGYQSKRACDAGPRTCIVSTYWQWGPLFKRVIEKLKQGSWSPADIIWEQIKKDTTQSAFHLSDWNSSISVPSKEDITNTITKLAFDSEEGRHFPFRGPLQDNKGRLRIAMGRFTTDTELQQMCWFVEGVVQEDGRTPAEVPTGCKGQR